MKPDKLVEKVAQLLYRNFSETDADWENLPRMTQQVFAVVAEDAIRIALEEAAKVAEAKGDEWATEWRAGLKCDSHLEGKSDGADDVATAIRAMIQEE